MVEKMKVRERELVVVGDYSPATLLVIDGVQSAWRVKKFLTDLRWDSVWSFQTGCAGRETVPRNQRQEVPS